MTGLIVSPEAEADLRDIGDYIAERNLCRVGLDFRIFPNDLGRIYP